MKKLECATIGWGLLATGVALWDILAPQTLSSGVDRYLEHPVKRIAAIGAVAVTGAHLLNLMPEERDPFEMIGHLYGKVMGCGK